VDKGFDKYKVEVEDGVEDFDIDLEVGSEGEEKDKDLDDGDEEDEDEVDEDDVEEVVVVDDDEEGDLELDEASKSKDWEDLLGGEFEGELDGERRGFIIWVGDEEYNFGEAGGLGLCVMKSIL